MSLFCLSVCVIWYLVSPIILSVHCREGLRRFILQHKSSGLYEGLWSCVGCQEGLAGCGGPSATSEASDLPLPLYVTLFPPLLDCAVLSLVTPVPRRSGQECLDFCSWWLATDATCLTDGLSIISLHRSLLSCPLFPSSRLLPFPQVSHLCWPLMGMQKSFCYSQATLGPGKLCKIIQCSICLDAPTWLFPPRDLAAFWILHLGNDLRSFLPSFAVPTNTSPSCFLWA